MENKIQWLREITGIHDTTVISRAHLPRMLAKLDWIAISVVINDVYGEQIQILATHLRWDKRSVSAASEACRFFQGESP